MSLTEMMRSEVEAFERIGFPREHNLKAAVLDHGRAYELDREASAAVENGALKECFANAGRIALDIFGGGSDEFTYCEGFAHSGMGIAVHHAWLVNAEGKAIEVTWRDGGDECGFCTDGEQELDETYEGYDEDDESTWVATCYFCGGTGKAERGQHRTLEDAEYYGIEIEADTLRKIILRTGTWGALNTPEDLAMILADEKETA